MYIYTFRIIFRIRFIDIIDVQLACWPDISDPKHSIQVPEGSNLQPEMMNTSSEIDLMLLVKTRFPILGETGRKFYGICERLWLLPSVDPISGNRTNHASASMPPQRSSTSPTIAGRTSSYFKNKATPYPPNRLVGRGRSASGNASARPKTSRPRTAASTTVNDTNVLAAVTEGLLCTSNSTHE